MCSLPEDDKRDLTQTEKNDSTVNDPGEKILPGEKKTGRKLGIWILSSVLVIFFDQLSKLLVQRYLVPIGDFPIIKGVLHLTYVENRGAAFGMLEDHRWVFMTLSCLAVAAMIIYLIAARKSIGTFGGIAISFIIGGGIGNMIDRIMAGFVTDFINFELIEFAVFNLADSAVCVGAALLILYVIFFDRKEPKKDGGK